MNGQLLDKICRGERKRKSVKKNLKRGNNINWHRTSEVARVHLNSSRAEDGVEHSEVCRLWAYSGRYNCALVEKLKLRAVRERGGQIWGPKGAISAARLTLNRHTGTTERVSWDALGEHAAALCECSSSRNSRSLTLTCLHVQTLRGSLQKTWCCISALCLTHIIARLVAPVVSPARSANTNTPGNKIIWGPSEVSQWFLVDLHWEIETVTTLN